MSPRVDESSAEPGTTTISVASTLVTAVGIVGAAVLACVMAGWMFGSSVLLSTAGSMAPTMPTAIPAVATDGTAR